MKIMSISEYRRLRKRIEQERDRVIQEFEDKIKSLDTFWNKIKAYPTGKDSPDINGNGAPSQYGEKKKAVFDAIESMGAKDFTALDLERWIQQKLPTIAPKVR